MAKSFLAMTLFAWSCRCKKAAVRHDLAVSQVLQLSCQAEGNRLLHDPIDGFPVELRGGKLPSAHRCQRGFGEESVRGFHHFGAYDRVPSVVTVNSINASPVTPAWRRALGYSGWGMKIPRGGVSLMRVLSAASTSSVFLDAASAFLSRSLSADLIAARAAIEAACCSGVGSRELAPASIRIRVRSAVEGWVLR